MTDAEGIACANLRMSSVSAASGRNTTSCNGTFNGADHKAEEAKNARNRFKHSCVLLRVHLRFPKVCLRVRLLYIQDVILRTHKRLWGFAHGGSIRITEFLDSTIHSSIVLLLGLVIVPILKSNLQPSRCLRKNDLRSKSAITSRVQQ